MSWWLSGAVQGYLDRQLYHEKSTHEFGLLSKHLLRSGSNQAGSGTGG